MRWRGVESGTLILVALAGASCVPLSVPGSLGDVISGGYGALEGQVRSVDTRRDRLTIRDRRGRQETVRFDRATVVVYRQRRYPVSALERGDEVRISLADHDRRPRAQRIDVVRTVQDRRRGGDTWDRTERVDGRVGRIDRRRGWFTIGGGRSSLTVHMPPRADRRDARAFQRLRRGDRVRATVRMVDRGSAVLVRFR